MRLRAEAKVGLIVFLALVALGIVYWFFGGLGLRRGTYPVRAVFDDVVKLTGGAEVRLAGVRIGIVDKIGLTKDKKARVDMLIGRQYLDAVPDDSLARITTGGLSGVGDYYVEITPGTSRSTIKVGKCLRTAPIPKFEAMLGQVQTIVNDLQRSVASVSQILDNPELRTSLMSIVKNVEDSTEETAALVKDVHGLVASNSPQLEKLVADTGDAARNFAAASRDVRIALERGGLAQVQSALASANRTAENLEATSASLRRLAEDEKVNAQIRETVENASQASKGAADIIGKINKVLGVKKGRKPGEPRSKLVPGLGSRLDVFGNTHSSDLRVDYNYTGRGLGDGFYRLGVFDFGENTRLNAQLGKMLDSRSAIRYGLYASKIGIGYDRQLSDSTALQFDLFRPNDPILEAKLRYDFAPDFGAWVGFEDVFGARGALLGLQYRR